MNKLIFSIIIMLLIGAGSVSSQEVIDGIVAIVGEDIILKSELLQTAQGFALQMGVNPRTDTDEFMRIKENVLQNMINEKIMLIKAEEDTITVDDQQVEAALEERIQALIQQAGSAERVESYFGAPIRKIKRDYREDVREYLIVQRVQQSKLVEVQVTRREVETFYEMMKDSLPEIRPMVKLRHILISVTPGETANAEAMEQMQDIVDRLNRGESFESLARNYSEDPGTASRGGNLGFVERGTLYQAFEEAAFVLEPGELSDIVQTPVGLHLIQGVEKRGEQVNVRHILIRMEVSDLDYDAVYRRLNIIRERIIAGESFDDMASEFSEDRSTKENGGDLGWLPVGELQIEAFNSVVDSLEVGEISLPFETQYGYHIVMVEDRSESREYSMEEDWNRIMEMALNTKRQRVLAEWIDDVKKGVFVDIKQGML